MSLDRLRDFLRFKYPLKFDFCRMMHDELKLMVDELRSTDRAEPSTWKPIVGIGHTKDLSDPDTVDRFLTYLDSHSIRVSTFTDVYPRLKAMVAQT